MVVLPIRIEARVMTISTHHFRAITETPMSNVTQKPDDAILSMYFLSCQD